MTTSLSRFFFMDDDVGLAVGVVGADELIAQSDFAAEVGGPGFFGEEGIGAGFDQAAIGTVGDHDSAEARGGFEQDVFDLCVGLGAGLAFFFKRERGREAGDSAADDGDAWHKEAASCGSLRTSYSWALFVKSRFIARYCSSSG